MRTNTLLQLHSRNAQPLRTRKNMVEVLDSRKLRRSKRGKTVCKPVQRESSLLDQTRMEENNRKEKKRKKKRGHGNMNNGKKVSNTHIAGPLYQGPVTGQVSPQLSHDPRDSAATLHNSPQRIRVASTWHFAIHGRTCFP